LQQETPIRVAETFEQVFYDRTFRRASTESMAAYIVRRKREFDKLKEISDKTEISDDIKAHLLLKFSGLSTQQRSQVVASCANQFNLKLIEGALRTQFANIHEKSHENSSSTNTKGFGKKGRHGGSKSSGNAYNNTYKKKPYGVWSAEADGEYEPDYYTEEDAYNQDDYYEYYEADSESHEAYYEAEDEYEPHEDADQDELDAFAARRRTSSRRDARVRARARARPRTGRARRPHRRVTRRLASSRLRARSPSANSRRLSASAA
jgi:hypothetical protein